MKIYGIAETENKTIGHGSAVDLTSINPVDLYGGPLPPFFKSQEAAEDWIKQHGDLRNFEVIECELVD